MENIQGLQIRGSTKNGATGSERERGEGGKVGGENAGSWRRRDRERDSWAERRETE